MARGVGDEQDLARVYASVRPAAGHLPEETFEALLDRTLGPSEREEALEHVLGCAECALVFRGLLELQSEAGAAPAPVRQSWFATPWGVRSAWLGMAASLTLALTLGLRVEKPVVDPVPPAGAPPDGRRIAELERRLSALERPQVNVPIVELQPDRLRSARAELASVPRTAARALLVLSSLDERRFDGYGVELIAPAGGVVLRADGLVRTPHGTFSLELALTSLAPGRHRLRLFGVRQGRELPLEEFTLQLE